MSAAAFWDTLASAVTDGHHVLMLMFVMHITSTFIPLVPTHPIITFAGLLTPSAA